MAVAGDKKHGAPGAQCSLLRCVEAQLVGIGLALFNDCQVMEA